MSRNNVFVLAVLLLLKSAYCQVPTLDPTQTVNPSGEMGFALPLGTVQGVNGHDFPINLCYQAGIRISQEASPVGLGFDVSAGTITRKTIFVPDENIGGARNYSMTPNQACNEDDWVGVVSVIITAVSYIVGLFIPPLGFAIGIAGSAFSMIAVSVSPADYRAGGFHNPTYQYSVGNGKGFSQGGSSTDLPDIYFVNTPYINGQIVSTSQGYTFVAPGQTKSMIGHVAVDFNPNTKVFKLTLNDGTRLIFDKYDLVSSSTAILGNKRLEAAKQDCFYSMSEMQNEKSVSQWHLSKVIYPDFVGNELNPQTTDRGSWISFDYQSVLFQSAQDLGPYASRNIGPYQQSTRDVASIATFLQSAQILKGITTPNEHAAFSFVYDRLDNSPMLNFPPLFHDSLEHFLMPRYSDIKIFSNNGTIRNTINFNTKYLLRPNTTGSIATPFENAIPNRLYCIPGNGKFLEISDSVPANPTRASLTLLSVGITGENNSALPPIVFSYDGTGNPSLSNIANATTRDGSNCCKSPCKIEDMDLWGYYNPSGAIARWMNDFNTAGLWNKAEKTDSTAYADAWSLSGVQFPNGKSINWYYESQRYDQANGVTAKRDANNQPMIKYGGGIRVKKIEYTDGVTTKRYNRWFFYTDTPGDFRKTEANCSGQATCEPFPYSDVGAESEDPRPQVARGGLYTAAKVAYEMVQIVDNYVPPTVDKPNGYAPNGYAVYEYYTCKEYPNVGLYGDIDMSWQRGYLKRMRQIDSKGDTITDLQPTYRWQQYETTGPMIRLTNASGTSMSIGEVSLVNSSSMVNGVKKSISYSYADDPNAAKTPDQTFYNSLEHKASRIPILPGLSDCAFTKTNVFGNTQSDDIILATIYKSTNNNYSINVAVAADVQYGTPVTSAQMTNWRTVYISPPTTNWRLLGVDFVDWDGNGVPDIVVESTGGADRGLQVDVILNPTISNGVLNGSVQSYKMDFYSLTQRIVSATIGDVDGNSKPDIILGIMKPNDTKMYLYCIEDANDPNPGNRNLNGAYIENGRIDMHLSTFKLPTHHSFLAVSYCMEPGNYIQSDVGGAELTINNGQLLFSSGAKIFAFTSSYFPYIEQLTKNINHSGWLFGGVQWGKAVLQGGKRDVPWTDNKERATILAGIAGGFTVVQDIDGTTVQDFDGIPNQTTAINSNGTKVLTQSIPAYWKYPVMNTSKHMLSENYGSIIYKTSVAPQNAVSASATTWKDWGNATWLPCSSFTWKSFLNASGQPTSTYADFNAASTTNPNWLFKGRIDKYNAASSVTQQTQPPGTPSVTKYSKLTKLPIATITNSNDSECAVWTCDYDDPSWTKRNATLTNVKKHFGEYCVYVNGGVGAQTGLYGVTAKDYTLSAWVCPFDGGSIVLAADKYINGAGTNVGYLEKIYSSTSFNNWFYVELTIPKANLMDMNGNGTMLVITVQSKGTSAQFCLDDVRFAPSNSLVNTTYYSSTFGLPILTVDQNNLPSERTTYDSFARPILSEKIDRTKSAGDASSSTVLAKKQYKLAAQ